MTYLVIGSSARTYRASQILNSHGVRSRVVETSSGFRRSRLALVLSDGHLPTALACLEEARLPAREVFRETRDNVPMPPRDVL